MPSRTPCDLPAGRLRRPRELAQHRGRPLRRDGRGRRRRLGWSLRRTFELPALVLAWLGFAWGVTGQHNPLPSRRASRPRSFIETAHALAGVELTPGLASAASCPEAIWQAAKWWHEYYEEARRRSPVALGAAPAPPDRRRRAATPSASPIRAAGRREIRDADREPARLARDDRARQARRTPTSTSSSSARASVARSWPYRLAAGRPPRAAARARPALPAGELPAQPVPHGRARSGIRAKGSTACSPSGRSTTSAPSSRAGSAAARSSTPTCSCARTRSGSSTRTAPATATSAGR